MSAKKFILPAVAATALVGGVAGYLYFNGAPGDTASPSGIAKVIPDKAYMAAFISTDEDDWAKLKKFGTPAAQQGYEKSFKEFQQKMLSESNVDVEKDLKPWMGNVMMAMVPSAGGKDSEMLMAIAIKDKVSALNFANKLKNDPRAKTTETDYKGVKISESLGAKSQKSTYTAVLKDSYVIVGSNKKAIEQSIEASQSGSSFASNPLAAPLLAQKEGETVVARFYVPDYAGMVKTIDPRFGKAGSTLEQLQAVKSMVGSVSIDDVGLRLKGTMEFDPKAAIALSPASGKVAAQFPADTFAFVSGSNLNAYWNQNAAQAKSVPASQQAIDTMRGGAQMAGIDLDKDIFSWMDGEFAIGLMPITEGPLAQVGMGGAMVFNTTNRKAAEAALSKLDALGGKSLAIAQRKVKGQEITEWQTPQGALLGHGWLNDNTMFISAGGQLVTSLSSQPNASLEASDSFKAATTTLPKNNFGYFYVDVAKTMALLNTAAGGSQKPVMDAETTAIMESIISVGGTAIQSSKTTREVEAVMVLKPAK